MKNLNKNYYVENFIDIEDNIKKLAEILVCKYFERRI